MAYKSPDKPNDIGTGQKRNSGQMAEVVHAIQVFQAFKFRREMARTGLYIISEAFEKGMILPGEAFKILPHKNGPVNSDQIGAPVRGRPENGLLPVKCRGSFPQ